ncbi:MAG: hypothetical protein LBH79_08345 [Nitrososphaerota archaeon]|jgi:hypothetical protein|nr:hypothetical protein [Nitrososphaerota archaeon]
MRSKINVLLLCIGATLILSSLTNYKTTQAEITPTKHPTPTLLSDTYKDRAYTVPVTTSTNPFTEKTTENPAYHIENMRLTMTNYNKNNADRHYTYAIRTKGTSNEVTPNKTNNSHINETIKTNPTSTTQSVTSRNNSIKVPPEGQMDFQVKIYEKINSYYPPSDGWPSRWIETLTA